MYFLFLILFYVQLAYGWNCPEYVQNYPEGKNIIPKKDRSNYITKVCLAISICHANPIVYSVEAYINDITQCYMARNYNFDQNIFEYDKETLETYINSRAEKIKANNAYDSANLRAKDGISGIMDIIRLREAYLREYQYSQYRDFTGDILMLLHHDQRSFSINSKRQLTYLLTYINTSREQFEKIKELEEDIQIAYERVTNTSNTLETKEDEFNELQQRIKENVIESLLVIEY
jgi:hypothetical protein